MNSADKYLQRRKLLSDENLTSLWDRVIYEQPDKYGVPRIKKVESQPEHKEKKYDSDNDFMEVWLSIEESIMNIENEQAKIKIKEEQSNNYRSKTNLNFEL